MSGVACYHCGEPVPSRAAYSVTVGGRSRSVCCPGCQAVAALIADAGLVDFYRYRDGPAPRPDPDDADEWRVFDRESIRQRFVRCLGGDRREIILGIEGLYCAACAWLIEHLVEREPGVVDIQVNPATGRALLAWDASRTSLSTLMRRIARAGYRPHPLDNAEAVPAQTRERRAALKRLAVAGLGMMQVMMYAVGLYAGAIHAGMDPQIAAFLRLVSLLVATPVVLYAGAPFFHGAWRDIRVGRPGMDVPVALAVGGAFAASVWNTLVAGGEVYFDSVTMFVFFLSVARFLEMGARHRAVRSTAMLAASLPGTALRLEGGQSTRVALAELEVGDTVRVRGGDPVPADGRIVLGEGHLDESLLTGEFLPAARGVGESVVGGSVNQGQAFDMVVERTGDQTLVSHVVRLLERAQSGRPRLAKAADRVARWFVAGVLVIAAATAVIWWHIDPAEAFGITLAVLVVTCPCALSLATPTALVSATARLSRTGVLVARTRALETLARADRVVFDKTGTLTRGRLSIRRTETAGNIDSVEARALAAALEAHSEHPIARAFAPFADGREAVDVRVHRGLGIEGVLDGRRLRLGRADWAAGAHAAGSAPATEVVLGEGGTLVAHFQLADATRPEAREAVNALRRAGLEVEIASGDSEGAVRALAAELGIAAWRARQGPDDKLNRLRELQDQGHRVVMVGDGINDAPVLAGADVSVAMGGGAALAHQSADMLLTRENLTDLADAVATAGRTLGVVYQNLAWAAAYNICALPLAMAGLVAPWMAALGMSASSLVVVANAMRLGRGGRRRGVAGRETFPESMPAPRVT